MLTSLASPQSSLASLLRWTVAYLAVCYVNCLSMQMQEAEERAGPEDCSELLLLLLLFFSGRTQLNQILSIRSAVFRGFQWKEENFQEGIVCVEWSFMRYQ